MLIFGLLEISRVTTPAHESNGNTVNKTVCGTFTSLGSDWVVARVFMLLHTNIEGPMCKTWRR